MSFFDALAEYMGWKRPTTTGYASDITDEQKQKWYDERAESMRKDYEDDRGELKYKIGDAKNRESRDFILNDSTSPYSGDWNGNSSFDTGVYEFTYYAPVGEGDPNSKRISGREKRTGRALLRTPKNKDNTLTMLRPYFQNDDGDFHGNIGVYEAVLDDGTRLDADELRDFIMSADNNFRWRKLVEDYDSNSRENDRKNIEKWDEYGDEIRDNYLDFLENYRRSQRQDNKSLRWDSKRRMWMVR